MKDVWDAGFFCARFFGTLFGALYYGLLLLAFLGKTLPPPSLLVDGGVDVWSSFLRQLDAIKNIWSNYSLGGRAI
jgi:hypothetical protein